MCLHVYYPNLSQGLATDKQTEPSCAHASSVKMSLGTVSSLGTYYYLFHTPMQGWGCGYRSLQTLCSWAENMLQTLLPHSQILSSKTSPSSCDGLSSPQQTVPSLRVIQETLVEVGDKPEAFVSSRDWIGTYEACIILDHLFGVSLMLSLRLLVTISLLDTPMMTSSEHGCG